MDPSLWTSIPEFLDPHLWRWRYLPDALDPNLWRSLPESLVEKSIARLPLKDLVRCRKLSKKWRDAFVSPSFLQEVNAVCSKWGPYYPLHMTSKGLVGYDLSSSRWELLLTARECGRLVGNLPRFQGFDLDACTCMGSLVVLHWLTASSTRISDLHIFLTNPVNNSSRTLPILQVPTNRETNFLIIPVNRNGDSSYRVLLSYLDLSYKDSKTQIRVKLYHSGLKSWTEWSEFPISFPNPGVRIVTFGFVGYWEGLFYIICRVWSDEKAADEEKLYSYDDATGLFADVGLHLAKPPKRLKKRGTWHGFVCDSQLIFANMVERFVTDRSDDVITYDPLFEMATRRTDEYGMDQFHYYPLTDIAILKLDLMSKELQEVSKMTFGSRRRFDVQNFNNFNDDRLLYFPSRLYYGHMSIVTFDVRKQVWSYIQTDPNECGSELTQPHFIGSAFQPSTTPFMIA